MPPHALLPLVLRRLVLVKDPKTNLQLYLIEIDEGICGAPKSCSNFGSVAGSTSLTSNRRVTLPNGSYL